MTAQHPISKPVSQKDGSYVDDYQPPAGTTPIAPVNHPTPPTPPVTPTTPVAPVAPTISTPSSTKSPESLQDQNIFYLLGVDDSTDEEKELFLDELQQVIWEDFVERDVKMIISQEEMTNLRQIMAKGNDQDVQEEMIVYLEKLIPDLEEIMLEKALELKEDIVWERIAGMREYNLSRPEIIAKLDEVEELAKKDQWHQVAKTLNAIGR